MKLKIGESIDGKLVEEVERDLWIISIDGNLLQVKNTSSLKFKKDKQVKLQVVRQRPLQLTILGLARRSLRGFDVRV